MLGETLRTGTNLRMPLNLTQLFFTVGELALGPIPAATLLLPAPAQLRLVQPQLSVVGAWAVP